MIPHLILKASGSENNGVVDETHGNELKNKFFIAAYDELCMLELRISSGHPMCRDSRK